jgi:phenylalanyl-tRNA synthetase beta chain
MGIARSSKRLKLRSESSARFERGIDPNGIATSAERAMELFAEVAGAKVAADAVDEYPDPIAPRGITLRTSKVNAVLGTALSDTDVIDALRPLGIEVEGAANEITATAPTFRPDLEREIDLVEEVARRVGFASIGRTVPRPRDQVGGLDRNQRGRRLVADALVGAGLSEAVTLPLVAPADLNRAGAPTDRLVEAANPLRAEESVLRTRILPGLLRSVAHNRLHGLPDVGLFEMGRVFLVPDADGQLLPDERQHLALALSGTRRRRPVEDDRAVDAYDAVDALRQVFEALELADVRFEGAAQAGFHAGRSAAVVVDGHEVGVVGEVDQPVLDALELARPVVAAELDLDRLLGARRRDRGFRAPSSFPPSSIDLAFVVDDDLEADAVGRTLRAAAGEALEDLRLFDVFRSDALGERRKSLAFALRFRAPDRTLTDEEVGAIRQRCIDAVGGEHGGELRG